MLQKLKFLAATFITRIKKRDISLLWPAPFLVPLFVALFLWWTLAPQFLPGHMYVGGKEMPLSMPLVSDQRGPFLLEFSFTLNAIHPNIFYFVGEDCFTISGINGKTWGNHEPVCGMVQGRSINLSEFIQPGVNVIRGSMENAFTMTALYMRPSVFDPLVILSLVTVMMLCWWACLVAAHFRGKNITDAALIFTLLFVCTVRIAYVIHTPYFFRNHDSDGHTEYITYIAEHLSLPEAKKGWEYWQPPLYYLVSAPAYALGKRLDLPKEKALFFVQLESVAMALASLVCCYVIARLAFEEKRHRILFVLGVGTLPGLIYLTSRINNDTLASALSFFAFLSLLIWWKKVSWQWWYAAMITIALAVVSKYNGLLLLPVAFLMLFFKLHLSWKTRAMHMFSGFLIVAVLLAGNMVRAHAGNASEHLIGNIEAMNGDLNLPVNLKTLVTFNPLEIIQHPYNNPWSDMERRANFPEYFFRSAFSGEWGLGDALRLPLQLILTLAMPILLVFALGVLRGLARWKTDMPFLCALFVIAGGHAAFRLVSPFSSSQDFRYSPLLAVPLFYFFLGGCTMLPLPVRRGVLSIFNASVALWILFAFSL
jgi:hypothetical protein